MSSSHCECEGVQAETLVLRGEAKSGILHAGRQSRANERQQWCNAVWLILGSLSARFYWEKWDDDRWISTLTAAVEGRVIVAERWRVFSVVAPRSPKPINQRLVIWTPWTPWLCVNGRRGSHVCFCVVSPLRLSRVMTRWLMATKRWERGCGLSSAEPLSPLLRCGPIMGSLDSVKHPHLLAKDVGQVLNYQHIQCLLDTDFRYLFRY